MKKTLIFIFFLLCGCGFLTDEDDKKTFNDPLDIKPMKLLWTRKYNDFIRYELYFRYKTVKCTVHKDNLYIHFSGDEVKEYITYKFNSTTGEMVSKIIWDDSNKFWNFGIESYYKSNDKEFFHFEHSAGKNSFLYYFDNIKDVVVPIKTIDANRTVKILGVYKNSLIIHESNKVEVDYDGKLLNNTKFGNDLYLIDFETKTEEYLTSFKEIEKENSCYNYYTDDLGSSIIVASYTKNNGIKEFIMAYDLNNNKLLYSDISTGYNNYKPNFDLIYITLISNFVVNNKSLLISSDIGSEIMRVFDVKTGKFKWSKHLPRHNVNSTTHQTKWSIYNTDKYLICFNEYFISSINPENGHILWTRESSKIHDFLILNDIGYLLMDGPFYAYDLTTGVRNWDKSATGYIFFSVTKNEENDNKGKVIMGSNTEIFCYEAIR